MKKSLNFCYQTSLLVNPLGAGRGHHKVIQIFYSLCEIPKNQRSKIDRIQLGKPSKKITVKLGFLSRVGWGGRVATGAQIPNLLLNKNFYLI